MQYKLENLKLFFLINALNYKLHSIYLYINLINQ